jgi:hypothetical protein
MNELLTMIIELVKAVPEMAIWVLVIIYGYKIAIAGTVYGCIKFAIKTICKCVTERGETEDITYLIDNITCYSKRSLMIQLQRLADMRSSTGCIHDTDVDWLRHAINEKLEREKK